MCLLLLAGCVAFWVAVVVMAFVALDWLIIAAVIALAFAVYFVILRFIDSLIDYWRSYRDN